MAVCFIVPAISHAKISFPDTLAGKILWKKKGPVEHYPGKKLYEYIDGEADIYFSYGFKTCFSAKYVNSGTKNHEIEVNVYNLDKAIHAFGLFRELSAYDTVKSRPGIEGVITDNYIYFYKDRYYVALSNKSSIKLNRDVFFELSQLLSKQITGQSTLPKRVAWFPKKGKLAGSERYVIENFLSRSYLGDVVSVQYNINNTPFKLFILSAATDSAAGEILKKIENDFRSKKDTKIKSPLKKFPHSISDKLVAIQNGSRITGVSGVGDMPVIQSLILECVDLQE